MPPPFNEPVVALPDNGELVVKANYSLAAPFEVKSQTGQNYLVKLTDTKTGQDIMTVFVRGGDTVKTQAPFGQFVVKYAAGDTWYGYEHLFGPDTAYSKADETFYFKRTISDEAQRRLFEFQRQLAIADANFRSFLSQNGMSAKQSEYIFEETDTTTGEKGVDRLSSDYWKNFISKIRGVPLHNAIIDRLNARNQIANQISRLRSREESIDGFSVTLYRVRDGNLHTSSISPSDF